jgi:hypothetical protein
MEIAEHGRIAPAFVGIVAPVPLAGADKKKEAELSQSGGVSL